MFRIMIVDDERIILNGIHMMIENELNLTFPTDIVTAANGLQALDYLNHFAPDIILTDIRMPVIDGFEFIRQVRGKFPAINIVILTSHADFEYAQQAIRFQVTDFILKPVSVEMLKKTIEQAYLRKQEKNQAALRSVILELRNMMIYDLSEQELISTPEQICQVFPHTYFTVIVIELSCAEESYSSILDSILKKYFDVCYNFLLKEKGQLIAICNHVQFSVKFYDLEQELHRVFHNEELFIGISISSNSYKALHNLYINSVQRILYTKHFGGNNALVEISLASYQECVQIFTENDYEKVHMLLREYLDRIDAFFKGHTHQMIFDSFFYNIYLYLENNGISVSLSELLSNSGHVHDKRELITEIIMHLNSVKKMIQKNYDHYGNEALIKQLLEYIRQNYQKDISLDDLAESVGLHPNYVCSVFKRYVGQSYLAYLHNERLNAAKKLLLDTDYTMEQIANEVGYSSSSQLARIFRKYESISPSDFRNLYHNYS